MKQITLLILFLFCSVTGFSQDLFMQNGTFNQCSGTLYDSGGGSTNYGSNENYVLTICPENPGQLVQLNFTAFNTQLNTDILTIYNGDSTAEPVFGGFSGGPSGSPGFVSATQDNTTGCITLEFVSDGTGTGSGWAATISCLTPCQTINSQIDSTSPAPNALGYIRVCPNEEITLTGSATFSVDGAGATYEWDLGDGNTIAGQTATFSYPNPGVYIVNLNVRDANTSVDPLGCENDNLINQVIQVATEPDFTGTQAADPTLCFGETTTIAGVVTPVEFLNNCTPPVSGTTFLPDGNGVTYETSITVDCYESAQTLTDINQLMSICVTMEHSYLGDLDIEIISPNGQTVRLHDQGGNSANLGTPWATAGVDGQSGNTTPGIGAQYCFVPGNSNPTLVGGIVTGGTFTSGNGPGTYTDSYVPGGTYSSINSLNALLGSPLNGDWTIRVVDNIGADNGYIFAWSIEFDPNLQPPELSFTPAITSESWDPDPTITSTNGNIITVAPPTPGQYCYTYRATDDFGCEYSEQVCITMAAELFGDVEVVTAALCSGEDAEFLITGVPEAQVTYEINGGPPQTVILDTSGNATITVPAPTVDQTITLIDILTINDPITGNGIIATGGVDPENAIGPIETNGTPANNTNAAKIQSGNTSLTLTLGNLVPAGTNITISAGKNNTNSNMTVSDGVNTSNINTGTLNVLTYHTFTTGTDTDQLTFTRVTGDFWIDGVVYTFTPEGCNLALTASASALVGQIFDTTFTLQPTCNGALATIIGDTGGVFAFEDPQPTDGAIIDAATGAITNGVGSSTYDVVYSFPANCGTDTTQSVTVLPQDDSSFSLTPTCDGAIATVTGLGGGAFSLNPDPMDGTTIDAVTGLVTGGNFGTTYTVSYTTNGTCPSTTTQSFDLLPSDDASFTLSPTCDGATATVSGTTNGIFSLDPIPSDGAIIDASTGTITNGVSGTSYTVRYTTNGNCPASLTQDVTVIPVDDASFTITATCDGGISAVSGTPNGVFSFDPVPSDGAIIDTSSGVISNGLPGTTYTIRYTTVGDCPATDVQSVTVLPSDDSTFSLNPTCDGGTANVSGTSGGVFSFDPDPMDGAVIDSSTGTVTNGVSGAVYTIRYTTQGVCPVSETQVLAVLVADDSSFDVSPTCDGATVTITGLIGGTFAFNPNPSDGAIIDSSNGTVTGGVPGSSYTIAYTTVGSCPTTTQETFSVFDLPTVVMPSPLYVCDDNVPDGLTSIDLGVKSNEITGGNPQYAVSYHMTSGDASTGASPLPVPYTNVSNPQTVYVRVVDTSTGCWDITDLVVEVEQAPVAYDPSPLEYCDADSDGFGVFTLTDAEPQITGGAGGLTVTYHETMADAENNVNGITGSYNNIVAYAQTIYVRVESATIATDCATFVTLQLIVNDTPQIEDPTPLEVCDDNTDGFAQFDLTLKNAEILDGLDATQYTVSYYEQQVDAEAPSNAIATPNAYTNTTAFSQTLWVRVDDTGNGCHKLTTLELLVNALPVLVQPDPLELCDTNNPGDGMEAFDLEDADAQILNGQTGIVLTYYETQADADAGTSPISSPYMNTSNPQTIYVRAQTSATGCVDTITLDLRVNPLPSPAAPMPIEVCDADNDGFASFDLGSRTVQIINGESDVDITYHETLAEADSGQNPLVSPYDNIVAFTQTVYARAENSITGCYSIVPMVLTALPSPVVPTDISDYVVCDTNSDGFAQFNLTTKNAEILGSQDASQYTISYHTLAADAGTGANPIVNVTNYTNATNPQTIYVRLVGAANGCSKTGEFEIRVELPPTAVQPTPLNLCDDEVADEMTVFDLTVKDAEITGGNGSWSVGYYLTSADAQAGSNAISPATSYTNMSVGGNAANPQTLYVRVTDTDTGCTDFTTLTIRVLPNPTPSTDPSDIELCDDINTGDGQELFDLTDNETYIINGESGVSATYHETYEDAEAGTGAIADPTMYTNTNTDFTPQTIYVRVTNDITGCYTIVDFDIVVNPLPEVVAVTDYIVCEVNTDGFAQFDLSSKDAEVLNGQDASLYSVTYHTSQTAADNLTGALLSPYTNTSNPQQIYVAITNTLTGCSISTVSFNLEVDNGAEATAPALPYIICDNIGDNDGLGQFDLTTQDAEILNGQDATNFIVSYYATQADAELGVNPIPTTYENISNPQVVYVRVDNDTPDAAGMDSSICYALTELTLQVNLLPIFDLDDFYTLCTDANGTEVIGLPLLDTGLPSGDYSFEWSLDGTVLPGETGPSLTATQSGTYTVVATNTATGCENTDSAEVVVSSPPTVTAEVATQAFSEIHVIIATAVGDGEYEYSLDGGPWQSSGTFEDVTFGEHVVTARDVNGCGQASYPVTVLDYPHFFTPNGDGRNETWNIVGFSGMAGTKIYIFDRFGKLLKQISPLGTGWDGTYNGSPMPSSDYWFTVEYEEDGQQKQFRAHFTLKR